MMAVNEQFRVTWYWPHSVTGVRCSESQTSGADLESLASHSVYNEALLS